MSYNLMELYNYQQLELKLAAMEYQFKETETRKKLLQRQKYLQETSALAKKIERDAMVRHNMLSEMENTLEKLKEQDKMLKNQIESLNEETDIQVVKSLLKECEALNENISKNKKRLIETKKASEQAAEDLSAILPKMAKAKKEFDLLKLTYAKEMERTSPELEEIRRKTKEAAEKIPVALMKKYESIKKTLKDPVAVIEDGKCSGCNMQLPSGNLAAIKNSDKIHECDNCGRILMVK